MIKILVVEDDKPLNDLVCAYLRSAGYQTTACFDGEQALAEMENNTFSLLLTDIMMPKMDGFALAEAVRAFNQQIPILFMSAREDKPAKLLGYKLGIDDYVVKPFDLDELTLKVTALLRRAKINAEQKIELANFTMNLEERSAYINGEELPLTAREFNLLFKLLSYPKKTFTRSALMDEFWDYDSSATSRTVDVYMAKIREKTSACTGFEIVTVHGLGYKAVLK
ncbi:MAG: response regulator transcription factor [Clostridiales bacterium]|nr:response regulator transcription factor [Clostridiales bacterium]